MISHLRLACRAAMERPVDATISGPWLRDSALRKGRKELSRLEDLENSADFGQSCSIVHSLLIFFGNPSLANTQLQVS